MAVPIRILSLLILITALAGGHGAVLSAAGLVLLATWAVLLARPAPFDWAGWWRMLRRVRWLLLTLLILYGGFTPGEALWPALAARPSVAGVMEGTQRIAALIAIVSAVYLLLWSTPRAELLAGLLWFGAPLRRLGIDDRPFAARLVLALEAVPQVQTLARQALADSRAKGRVARVAEAGSRLLQQALQQAEAVPETLHIPDRLPIPAWQWLIPLTLLLLFSALALPG